MRPPADPEAERAEILRRIEADAKHQASLHAELRPHVLAALDAADIAPDSAAGRYALDAAADAGQLVRDTEMSRDAAVDREIAAVDLVLMAARETARGVRTVRG